MINDDKPNTDTGSVEDEAQDVDLAREPETVAIAAPRAKRGAGFGALLLMSLLAAGGGAVGGAALTHHGLIFPAKTATPSQTSEATAMQADITALKAQLSSLSEKTTTQDKAEASGIELADLTMLEERLTALENQPRIAEDGTVTAPAPLPDLTPLTARIEALETAAKDSAASAGEPSDVEARIKALETALAQNETDEPSEIETRLAALEETSKAEPLDLTPYETRIAALETVPAVIPADVSGLKNRLDRLETALGNVRAALPLPEFPSAKILEALSQDGEGEKGWLGRQIGKHVKVASEASAQQVANIEELLAAGDIDTALTQAKELPENGRAAAQDWIDAVTAQRKLP